MSKDHLRKGETVRWLDSAIAGSISGLIARALTAPMDTLKIRYQLQPTFEKKYGGIRSTVSTIIKEEGWKALWKGNIPASLMYVLYGAVQFGSYSCFNNLLPKHESSISPQLQSLVVGALSGMTSSLVTYPLDILRTRLIANRSVSMIKQTEALREIYKYEGLRGFFVGISPAMTNITLSSALIFLTYETINILCEEYRTAPWSHSLEVSSGAAAGFVSKSVIFPIDTVRRRMQVMNSKQMAHVTAHTSTYLGYRNHSFYYILYDMLMKEGPRSLYNGLSVALCKSVPTTAISLFVFEHTMQIIDRR